MLKIYLSNVPQFILTIGVQNNIIFKEIVPQRRICNDSTLASKERSEENTFVKE